jgi:hypothetical protein
MRRIGLQADEEGRRGRRRLLGRASVAGLTIWRKKRKIRFGGG